MDNRWVRSSFVYLLIVVAILAIFFTLFPQTSREEKVAISDLLTAVQDDVNHQKKPPIIIQGNRVIAKTSQGDKVAIKEERENITELLQALQISPTQVKLEIKEPSSLGNWLQYLTGFLPVIVFGAILLFMMRQAQGSNNQALSFGKSRARMFMGNKPTITFADVAGVDEAKQELQEVVEFLKYPEKFAQLGARIPRGVLLVGPPGVGKTHLSRAVAGEAGVPFFSISGSEFVEMFVGVGASRVRDLFDQAKRNAPCIVFVDEIDAVGRQRGAGLGGSHDEREQTLNQILVEMDGFDTNTNVIVLAATNRPDVLDPALLRPGRFDRTVVLDRPDIRGRRSILDVHARGKPFEKEVSLESLARATPGFSGADLANLINEAAILAARRNKKAIGMAELSEASERIIMGPERKSRVMSEKEKIITAYHEVGHAVVAKVLPNCDPVQKISIVSRGMANGYTLTPPAEDRTMASRSQFEDELAMMLGGRAVEELVFSEITTGAVDDIRRATERARQMVTEFGMSRLGPRAFGKKEELIFLGRDIAEQRNYSEATAQDIDREVSALIDRAYQRAREALEQNMPRVRAIAEQLIREETIDQATFNSFFEQEPRVEAPREPVGVL